LRILDFGFCNKFNVDVRILACFEIQNPRSKIQNEKGKGIKMGARGYVAKPFGEDELKSSIKSIFEKEEG
jgi:hypothetical protein